jgi:hypothetical protein
VPDTIPHLPQLDLGRVLPQLLLGHGVGQLNIGADNAGDHVGLGWGGHGNLPENHAGGRV